MAGDGCGGCHCGGSLCAWVSLLFAFSVAVVVPAVQLSCRTCPGRYDRQVSQVGLWRLCRFRRFRGCAGLFCDVVPSRVDVGYGERIFHRLQIFRALAQFDPLADHARCTLCSDHPGAADLLQPQADQDLCCAGCLVHDIGIGGLWICLRICLVLFRFRALALSRLHDSPYCLNRRIQFCRIS